MEHGTKKFQLHDDLIEEIDGVLLKISKTLPVTGELKTIYFDNGVLKTWDGTFYNTVVSVSDSSRTYYAKKSDIVNVAGQMKNIAVIEDEDNDNSFTHYFYNGTELQWIVSVNQ